MSDIGAVDIQTSDGPEGAHALMRDRYLSLLQRALTRYDLESASQYTTIQLVNGPRRLRPIAKVFQSFLRRHSLDVVHIRRQELQNRYEGKDWPENAETMIGIARLDNLRQCLEQVFTDKVTGDVLEAGVWRGGASIYMRAVMIAYGEGHRNSWLADSFRGLPAPDVKRYPADRNYNFNAFDALAISQQEVSRNFEKFGLLDEHVHFLEGWFEDTLPNAPVSNIALLRLDGDLYASTMQTLVALYDKVSSGGFVVVDDYNGVLPCKLATDDFRSRRQIAAPLVTIDWTGVYWRKVG